ncbi:unnamed protein product [Rhizopus stolonifer]
MNTKNREKIFTPLVLFNNSNEAQIRQIQKYQIEDHRLKVEKLLEHNTRLWENEGTFSSPEIDFKENTISDVTHHDHAPSHPFSSYPMTENFTLISALEPKTRTKTPPPLLGFLPANKKVGLERQFSHAETNHIIEDGKEAYSAFDSSPHFINEPPFNQSYKSHSTRKRRGNLPKEVTEFLKQWLLLHKRHPYPTEREKQQLADETGLMVSQISNWFINARRRILQPLLESENRHQMMQPTGSIQDTYFSENRHSDNHHQQDSFLINQKAFYYNDRAQMDNHHH